MAIEKMKHLQLIAMREDRDRLMTELMHLGCLELREPPLDEEMRSRLLLRQENVPLSEMQVRLRRLQEAVQTLQKYAPQKTGLLTPRPQISEQDFLDEEDLQRQWELAQKVNDHVAELNRLGALRLRLQAEKAALSPWGELNIPMELTQTQCVDILTGALPGQADFNAVQGALSEEVPETELFLLSQSREQLCVLLLCHKAVTQNALEKLRVFGFTTGQLKDRSGSVSDTLARLEKELAAAEAAQETETAAIKELGVHQNELKLCIDRVSVELEQQENRRRLLTDGCIICLTGWAPTQLCGKLSDMLDTFSCAYEWSDPTPEEYREVPVKLKNNFFTRCLNVVTEMYSLPAYDGVDANPLMAPFFILFFGMMMADMAYGLLMIAAAVVYLRKKKPAEGGRNFMELVLWCGISTFIVGALTGGFFGDFIPQLLRIRNPNSTFALPALFTPLDDTIAIMIGSLVLGVIQIFTGMTVSVVRKCKAGCFQDALWNEITWWVILAGVGLMAVGIGSPGGVPVTLCLGGVMLVIGSCRGKKGFGMVTSLIGNIYNGVTGFFSDILSYVRLMALMLSGSVIAQVFNTLGATFGSVVMFIIISMIGNALNLALNLLGCYVHDLRLQCLEFFGRFYQEGGKAYRPFTMNTKYVEIIKEDK